MTTQRGQNANADVGRIIKTLLAHQGKSQGVPATTVSKRLGHSRTSTTTDIYGHGTDLGEAQAVAAIERAFGPALPAPQ